jgi:starch synthase (maltosyl-transferring)
VFLAEAFTDPARMHALAEVGFSQSYTYFTWRTTKDELAAYGDELARGPAAAYFRPNLWPTTPDILSGPLRHGSPDAFRLRALLAATMSPSWGIYSGYELCENVPASESNEEFLDSEKYQLVDRDHDDEDSIAGFLAALNGIRRAHPSLLRIDSLRFHTTESEAVLAYSHHRVLPGSGPDSVLVVANLRPDEAVETTVHVDGGALGVDGRASFVVLDELTGERWTWRPGPNYVRLDPAERVGHVLAVEHG